MAGSRWFRHAIIGSAVVLGACGGATRSALPSNLEEGQQIAHPELYDEIVSTGHYSAGRPDGFVFNPSGSHIYYLKPDKGGEQALFVFKIEPRRESLVANVSTLLDGGAVKLSAEEKARRERLRERARGITRFSLSEDGETLMVPLSGQVFVSKSGKPFSRLRIDGHALDARLSPDAKKVAYVKERDLFVYDLGNNRERRIVKAGIGDVRCGLPEFVAQEEMRRYQGFWWSPDSQKIAYQCNDESEVEALFVQDPARPEQPAASLRYPRAGTPNVSVRFFVHDLRRRRGTEFSLGDDAEYLADVRWSEDSRPLPIVQDRAQQRMWMLGCGASKEPLSKCPMPPITHSAWINIDPILPLRKEDTWFSSLDEEDGRVVYMGQVGHKLVQLVPPNAGYRHALGVHGDNFYFSGGPEPTQTHIYRASLKSKIELARSGQSRIEQLTSGDGMHSATIGPNGLWINRASLASGEQHLALYREKTKVLDFPYESPTAPFVPSLEITSVTQRQHRVAIVRPRDFDTKLRYPVIVSVYGGPLTTVVRNAPRFYFMDQWLADQGFIVVKIDGRGTPHRDDAWEKVTRKDLITIPLQDQVDALTALGARHPELDLERVGIQGWSFGGYFSAMAVMQRPDIFKAAIAGAPVTDWRDYDTHYTERYMGLPSENKKGYDHASVLTHAAKLERPLMLVHGIADDNVLYTHTARLVDVLIRENKDFDLVPLVGATHMGGSGQTRRALQFRYVRFMKTHLGAPR